MTLTLFPSSVIRSLKTQEVVGMIHPSSYQGLKRVLQNRKFTESEKVQRELEEYEEANNPILGFIRECESEEFNIENEPTNDVYKRYHEYCLANSLQPMSNIEFSKQINKLLNFQVISKRIGSKVYRIFVAK